MTSITVVNKSTLVTDAAAQTMTRAVAKQVTLHAAPVWSRTPIPVVFSSTPTDAAPGTWVIAILDDPDQAGALGWHTEDQGEVIYGRVFAKPVLDNGGTVLGPTGVSVSSVLSHECLETMCLAPETRVLTRDLNWVPIGDMAEGELLVGFDEENPGQGSERRYRLSVVESSKRIMKPCYELEMEDGTTLVSSADHRWLVNNGGRAHWVTTAGLISATPVPDARGRIRSTGVNASRIVKPLDTWEAPTSYVEGYLAAAFDGEGCLSQHTSSSGDVQCRLAFSQNENPMLDSVRRYLKDVDTSWTETEVVRAGVRHHRLYVSQKRDVLTILGRTRPQRLLEKFNPAVLGRMLADGFNAPKVMSKRFVGEHEVVALQTSTRTYIAEGFASHNCDPYVSLWADNGAGLMIALEVGDPVESDCYPIDVDGTAVGVSNFVGPHWFDPKARTGIAEFDWMGHLSAPFTMTPGGYWVQMVEGTVTQKFGDDFPAWKVPGKQADTSRTARRGPVASPTA